MECFLSFGCCNNCRDYCYKYIKAIFCTNCTTSVVVYGDILAKLEVVIQPNSKRNEIIFCEDGSIKIRIKEKPIEGRANKELIRFLKKILKTKVGILKGERSERKVLNIEGMEKEEIIEKLRSFSC